MSESTTLTAMQTFQERVKEKLRDDIASMLPDDVMAEMVKRVVEEEFFTKKSVRKTPGSYHDTSTVEVPSEFQKMVVDATGPIIARMVGEVLKENASRIEEQINEATRAGLLALVLKEIDSIISSAISTRQWDMQQALEGVLRNRGL